MSVKNYLLIGSALLLSACATSSMVDETSDIANQFCLSNANPHSEARKLLLSPTLTYAMKTAQMRHGIIASDPAPITENVETANTDLMPAHTDANADIVVVEAEAPAYTPVALCKPGRAFTMNGVRYAEIHHAPANGGEGWTDRLVLKQVDGKWMIDDILFAPDYRRTMRTTLIRAE